MRIRNAFEELFCLRSNSSNDIISTLRLGLKTGMNFRGLGPVSSKVPVTFRA